MVLSHNNKFEKSRYCFKRLVIELIMIDLQYLKYVPSQKNSYNKNAKYKISEVNFIRGLVKTM